MLLYDAGGHAVVYCDDNEHLYAFNGVPVAYLEDDSVYAFHGEHLGWWDHGWIRDHEGACVFFTEDADSAGLKLPLRRAAPTRAAHQPIGQRAYRLPKPPRAQNIAAWSLRSGPQFFPPRR